MSTSGRSRDWKNARGMAAALHGIARTLEGAEAGASLAYDFATPDEGASYRIKDIIARLSELRARVEDEAMVARAFEDRKALEL